MGVVGTAVVAQTCHTRGHGGMTVLSAGVETTSSTRPTEQAHPVPSPFRPHVPRTGHRHTVHLAQDEERPQSHQIGPRSHGRRGYGGALFVCPPPRTTALVSAVDLTAPGKTHRFAAYVVCVASDRAGRALRRELQAGSTRAVLTQLLPHAAAANDNRARLCSLSFSESASCWRVRLTVHTACLSSSAPLSFPPPEAAFAPE